VLDGCINNISNSCVCARVLTQNFPADFQKIFYFRLNKVKGVGRISVWFLLGKQNSCLARKHSFFKIQINNVQ